MSAIAQDTPAPDTRAALEAYRDRNYLYNIVVNLLDGGFFGFAIGFASFITVIPLFVSTLTNSAVLIGLIPSIHSVGWQLPQLFTANRVSRQPRYKPMVIWITIHERLPFLGLAAVAWSVPLVGTRVALALAFILLVWQGLGGGFCATAWQSMIGKIIPADRRGIFYGFQAAAANLFATVGAVLSGLILDRLESPLDFVLCFLFAGTTLMISLAFLALTREAHSPLPVLTERRGDFWRNLWDILRRDANFRWFLLARTLMQFATMAFAFYTVYAVRYYGMSEATAGVMTGLLTAVEVLANPIMGWLGDRWSYRGVLIFGALAASLSALVAWWAPSVGWFYLVFALVGLASVALWTISLTLTLQFGSEAERPAYIGLVNTLSAPAGVLAPLFGGWLADGAGYPTTFIASALGGLFTVTALLRLRDPS